MVGSRREGDRISYPAHGLRLASTIATMTSVTHDGTALGVPRRYCGRIADLTHAQWLTARLATQAAELSERAFAPTIHLTVPA